MRRLCFILLSILSLLVAACVPIPPAGEPPATPTVEPTVAPAAYPTAVEYNLGETTIT